MATDTSPIKGQQDQGSIKYDYLVYAVGAETQTFNIPGVKDHSCFMKELKDAEKVCVSSVGFYVLITYSYASLASYHCHGLSVRTSYFETHVTHKLLKASSRQQ